MRMYPEGGHASVGQKRWELEWYVMKRDVAAKLEAGGDFDPDNDQYAEVEYFPEAEHEQARRRAQQICDEWNQRGLTFAIVTVQEQEAEWFEERYYLGHWINVGEPEYFDEPQPKEAAA